MCEGTDRLVCVIHGHRNTATILEVKDLHPLWLTTLWGVDQLHLSAKVKLVHSKTKDDRNFHSSYKKSQVYLQFLKSRLKADYSLKNLILH